MSTGPLDSSITYFTCTLGEAAIFNAEHPHPFKTIRKLLDNLAEYYPNYAAVGFFEASHSQEATSYSVYGYKSLRETALSTAGSLGLPRAATSSNRAVALVGKSSQQFFFTWLGLVASGYEVLLLSPDLDDKAIAHLCAESRASAIIYDPLYQSLVASIEATIISNGKEFKSYVLPNTENLVGQAGTWDDEPVWPIHEEDVAYYHHSSGTSGLPKLLPVSHKMAIGVLPRLQTGHPINATFTTTPMYHGGPADCFRAWSAVSMIWLYPGEIAVTASSVIKCVDTAKSAFVDMRVPELAYFSCVPQVLASLTEHTRGINILKDGMKLVGVGGAAMPQRLGDDLVRKGIRLVSRFGSAECGFLLSSHRPYESDREWQFLRHNPKVDSIKFEPRDEGLFELVVLGTWPAMGKTNRPDGSFATADLFEPHPTISNAWRYHSRADSQINLVTGKKFDPVPLEDRIRECPLLDDILIFGTNQRYPGALLFPSAKGASLSNDEFLRAVWTFVEAENVIIPKHAQISRSMMRRSSDESIRLPKSSKGTTLRPKAETLFQQKIEIAYSTEHRPKDSTDTGVESFVDLTLDDEQVTQQLFNIIKDVKGGFKEISINDDLYNQGIDSNDCIKIISQIQKRLLPANSSIPASDMVYTCGNIANLASHVIALRKGTATNVDNEVSRMWDLVAKYSIWRAGFSHCTHTQHASLPTDRKQVVLLTGTTGSLGAHVLAQLRLRTSVREIHCLVRAENDSAAQKRLQEAALHRQLPSPEDSWIKIYTYACNLAKPNLGLTEETFAQLAEHVTHIIHAAWPVNFSLRLESFVSDSIGGLHNLIQLALASCRIDPPHFVFCSSTASVIGTYSEDEPIPEEIQTDTDGISQLGYSRSKWVAESICDAAHNKTALQNYMSVVRIGQLCGDTRHGVWNASEAFPLMLSSTKVTGSFPRLPSEPLRWMPLDVAARAVVDIANFTPTAMEMLINVCDEEEKHEVRPCRVYNLVDTSSEPTTDDLVQWIKTLSPTTKTVSPQEWLKDLDNLNEGGGTHPALKLLNFWRKAFTGKDDQKPQIIEFDTDNTMRASHLMREYTSIGEEEFRRMWQWIEENVGG